MSIWLIHLSLWLSHNIHCFEIYFEWYLNVHSSFPLITFTVESSLYIWIYVWIYTVYQFSSVQLLSHVQLFVTPWTVACQASLSVTNSQSLHKLMSIDSVMSSNHLILCRPLLPPSIIPSIRVFSNESALPIRWQKYWSFSFNISLSNEHPVLIAFRMDWLDLLAVQGTLKGLLQQQSSKASILQCSAFFIVQLSHPYMTTGKTIALTRWTFVGKLTSLLLNMLSRLVMLNIYTYNIHYIFFIWFLLLLFNC